MPIRKRDLALELYKIYRSDIPSIEAMSDQAREIYQRMVERVLDSTAERLDEEADSHNMTHNTAAAIVRSMKGK